MPKISEFYGIAIYMFYSDHAPPHFHAYYGEHESSWNLSRANPSGKGSYARSIFNL